MLSDVAFGLTQRGQNFEAQEFAGMHRRPSWVTMPHKFSQPASCKGFFNHGVMYRVTQRTCQPDAEGP